MKFLILAFLLSIAGIAVKAGEPHINSSGITSDTLPQKLSFGEQLKLLLDLRRLKPVPISGSRIVPYVGEESYIIDVSKLKIQQYNRFTDSLMIVLIDFALPQNTTQNKLIVFNRNEEDKNSISNKLIISIRLLDRLAKTKFSELSMLRKANLLRFLTGWEGDVNIENNTILYHLTVPKKQYSKKGTENVSRSVAALTYCWLLKNEDAKKWTVGVDFEKEKKRVWPVHPIYTYVGGDKDEDEITFDEVLQTQLEKH